MKKVILLALLMPVTAFGQIRENFETGTLVNWQQSIDGHWKADSSESLSGKYSLHHIFDNPDAGIDCAGIKIQNLHPSEGVTRWSFLVRYGYDPSSSNNWSVFLIADNGPSDMSAEGTVKGFALGVNLIGSDDTLRLWKVNGNTITTIINSHINWQTNIGTTAIVKISVERSITGIWTVFVSTMNGNIIGTGSGNDIELFNSLWFGVYYKYSSTKDRLLWFDDISVEGTFYEDKDAPVITSCLASGKKSVDITLNEVPANSIMICDNFSLNTYENKALSVTMINNLKYHIEFACSLINQTLNKLFVDRLCDITGNCTQNINFGFTPVWAVTGDIVISEIMADPLPAVSLPAQEYLEITNRTGYTFDIKNWRLETTGQSTLFPETIIPPSGIFIVCAVQDTQLFKKFGKVIGLKQFPSLTDAGRIIYLSDSTGSLIHGVEYSSDWYKDDLKSQGGWALEMIDTGFPFYYIDNWTASVSKKGGTPGTVNSVSEDNPDKSFYGIQNVFPEDSTTIHIRFSEPVFNLSEMINGIRIAEKKINGFFPTDPICREFSFILDNPVERNEVHTITVPEGITDFAGNPIEKSDFKFGLTESVVTGDVLFNEVLFNPFPGDPDYLELFNLSDKIIDASRLQVVSENDDSGVKSEAILLSDERRCFLPGEYYAVSTDTKKISDRYFSADPTRLFKTESLPSMSDDKGHLVLFNRELDLIDEFMYTDKMHYSLLSSQEGVSLEKIRPGDKSGEKTNWHSASESSGWGTPGAPNSMFVEVPVTSDKITFSSTKITPDNDGNEDILIISMNFTGTGNVISVAVFDETGSFVRKIATNLFAGAEVSLNWDGTSDDGTLVNTGIYIVLISVFDDTGKTEKWKKVCTVIRR